MTAFLVLLAAVSLAGVAASIRLVMTDGYGSIPDRSPAPRRPRRRASAVPGVLGSRFQSLRRRRSDWNRDPRALQTR